MIRILCIRASSSAPAAPPPAKFQLSVPVNEQGFFSYSRNWSRDKRYANPIQQGDTPSRHVAMAILRDKYNLGSCSDGWDTRTSSIRSSS